MYREYVEQQSSDDEVNEEGVHEGGWPGLYRDMQERNIKWVGVSKPRG